MSLAHKHTVPTRNHKRGARTARGAAACVVLAAACASASCVQGQRATDSGDPGFPFGPSAVSVQPLAYVPDIKPILDGDCLSCHSNRRARGNYSVETYAATMQGQTPGDARSSIVVDCAPGGSMYGYFSGDATTAATEIFRWIVVYGGAQSR
jgi:hypothetical protein